MSMKPKIGITMGDPNGIGPEIIAKALGSKEIRALCSPVVIGSEEIMEAAKRLTGIDCEYEIINSGDIKSEDLKPGEVSKKAGEASISYIQIAAGAALKGEIDAIVTAPISKESTHLAGSGFPGHTEMLKNLTGAEKAVMMFEGGRFRVVLVTIHEALAKVPELITEERVLSTIEITCRSLKDDFKIAEPKIVVCGLNPHAGESGAFGNEEIVHITPAVGEAVKAGIDVTGPLPADTLFYHANQGKWDAVVAMYHDQGLIPFKMVSFDKGVNVTIGLPIIRTSPDHGTAFDIAWKGKASPSSMIAAIDVAVRIAENRKSQNG
ncbi:MAG: 4-hydroxythreonine-4-phosphate dehydrogenase PdxA [Deltaproteobacteria bacterium]